MEIWGNDPNYMVCRHALERTPIHFMGISYKAELKAVYEVDISAGLYKLSIIYGPYALSALVCVKDPALSLFFDYSSMMVAVHCTVEQTEALLRKGQI